MKDFSIEDIQITLTDEAVRQIQLIQEHDFTVEGKVFRLKVDGKGCNGFDYALGFTDKNDDDFLIELPHSITLNLDPFTAYYAQKGEIDYIFDHENNTEGFYFENANEKSYRGKFFKNETKLPPTELFN